MKNKVFLAITALVVILAAGCSNMKDANKSNFKNAAQDFLDTIYPHCYITVNFPFKSDMMSFRDTKKILHVLSTIGIVTETEVSRRHIPKSFMSEAREEIIYSYELTDEGKKYYKADAAKNLRGEDLGGFCFGKATVQDVLNFTEPTDAMGIKVSNVTYTYKVADIPAWAKNPELLALDDRLAQDVLSEKTPNKRTDAFILTNNGWIHKLLFQK